MHCFRTLKLLLVLLLLSSLPGVNAKTASDDVAPLAPAAQLNALDRTIANLLSQHHYRQSKLDDRLSSLILNTYLDDLDANHAYFLASDIAAFEKYRSTLDDALKNGNLQPAYEILTAMKP